MSELSRFLEDYQLLQRVRLAPEPFVPKAVVTEPRAGFRK